MNNFNCTCSMDKLILTGCRGECVSATPKEGLKTGFSVNDYVRVKSRTGVGWVSALDKFFGVTSQIIRKEIDAYDENVYFLNCCPDYYFNEIDLE